MIDPPQGDQRYWNRPSQTAPREVLDARHLQRIKQLVGWAYENSPMHRRIYDEAGVKPSDIRTWSDFHHRLPFTDKPDYLADQDSHPTGFGGTALGPENWQQYFHTTGTTGRFLNETFTEFEMQKAGSQYCYALWDYGVRRGDSMYFCFNWGSWIGLWSFYWGARTLGLRVISGGGCSTLERIEQIVKHKPTVVTATPTNPLHLTEVAAEHGLDLRESGVRMVAGGGEAGLSISATRQKVSEAWNVDNRIMDAYGVGEAIFVGQSCRDWGGGVHVIEDNFHSFVVDPDSGEPVPDGEVGEHVITSFARNSQPFIKYRTHDLVRMDHHPDHGCGWTFAHLPGVVLGRADFMVTVRGVNVYPTAVENLLGEVAGLSNHYELHITREAGFDRMLVKVEADPHGERTPEQVDTELNELLRRSIGVRLETEVLAPESLPRYELKSKRVFDHRSVDERPQVTLGRS